VNQLGTGTATLTNAAAITNLGVSGGTMSLNAGSTVTNVAFTGAGTANLSNLTTAGAQTITFAGNNGTVTYGNGVTFTGSATTATTSGTGNLTFGDGATVDASATLGSATHKLNNINFAAGTNSIASAIHATTVNVGSGGLTSTNTTFDSGINFNADSTVTLASGTTSVGAVSTVTPGTGTLSFSGGPLSINGNLGQLKALVLTDNLSVTGNATAANALNIGTRTLTVGGTFATTADTQMQFFVTPNANLALPPVTGTVTATGIATVAAGTRVNMTVDTGVYVPEGQRYDLVTGAAGSTVADISAGLTTTNTALLHFKQDTTETGKLVVYAARTQMTAASKDPNNGAVGSMLDTLGAGGDADVTALQVRLANFMSTGEVEAMLSTLTPDVSGGAIGGLTTVGGSTANIIGDRVASLRNADGYETGMVAGNAFDNYHFWGQVFGAKADQDRRNFIAGYEADTYGFVGGVDTNVTDDFRLGAAFAYADTDVDSEDSNRTKTDIDSYQLSVYGDLDLKDNVFLSGQVSYLYGDIETRRHNVGGIAGNTARADFHSNQYGARAELGRKFAVDSNFTLTPSLLANYSHIDVDSYSEKGAGGLSLRNVKTDDMDILELGVNLIAEATYADLQGGLIKPNLHVGYRHDFIGDTVSTLGGLAGGGAAFRTNGADPAQNTVNVGAGIKWQLQNNLEFTANYDYEHKSDYDAHSGYIRAGYKF
jgi:outer membrane autotransporter protein